MNSIKFDMLLDHAKIYLLKDDINLQKACKIFKYDAFISLSVLTWFIFSENLFKAVLK